GNVGIGTTAPNYKLDVQNTGTNATDTLRLGDNSANCTLNPEPSTLLTACSSDIKIKKNILDAPSSIEKFKNIKIRRFDTDAGIGYIGVVAQELQETNPEMVNFDSGSGLVMVYEPNPWELVKAFQEVYEKVSSLEKGKFKGVGGDLITFSSEPKVTTERITNTTSNTTLELKTVSYAPTINTLNFTNLTITSAGGSVIIRLG
ncbi:MAG: tail fiber domain-containing protein, partial [Nanoarchaeota archaeon]|nr:tail fiber domain-containing protein [Nanoarchaeota archaeon]